MDEAFVPLSVMMRDMGTPPADLVDEEAGVHTYVTRFELESPVELDIGVDEHGRVLIGSNPPIYDVDTSYRPAYHRIRFTAERTEVLG
ncbi:hypothetical protein [Nocardioides zhouii]|uniref:Uncharacterized protein n=1 Tax=Nocardioides zhouii TaxID=1168729 RepID=A0A4V1RMX0_9ACTN|nr:hypothetical protein [Nocardioides zhouii]RYC03827.1 hypothetical protein EUA94_21505 [Nocardioides zhouii]